MGTYNGNAATMQKSDEDIVFDVPEDTFTDETIPSGAYPGDLLDMSVVDTPDWKMAFNKERNPDREPDTKQWEWKWTISSGEFEGHLLHSYTSRSWHRNSTANKYACALLNVPELDADALRGQSAKSMLIGRQGQLWVSEKEGRNGTMRNYVDKVVPMPRKRNAPKSPQDKGGDEGGEF